MHQANAFFKTFLPTKEGSLSQHQMSLYLKLILGLPIPAPAESVLACPCGNTHDFHGYHRLNCKHHAGRANRAAHDLVQQALKKELQRLGLHVVDNDNEMRQRFSHLSSQKRGDLAILSASDYLIYDQIGKQPLPQAITDIKMVSLVILRVPGLRLPVDIRTRLRILVFFFRSKLRIESMLPSTLLLALLFPLLLSPVLAL